MLAFVRESRSLGWSFLVWLLCCVDPEACLDWGNGQRLSLKREDGTPSLLKEIAIGIVECSIILKMELWTVLAVDELNKSQIVVFNFCLDVLAPERMMKRLNELEGGKNDGEAVQYKKRRLQEQKTKSNERSG